MELEHDCKTCGARRVCQREHLAPVLNEYRKQIDVACGREMLTLCEITDVFVPRSLWTERMLNMLGEVSVNCFEVGYAAAMQDIATSK